MGLSAPAGKSASATGTKGKPAEVMDCFVKDIEEDRFVALLLQGASEDDGRIQVTGGIESDETDAWQTSIPLMAYL